MNLGCIQSEVGDASDDIESKVSDTSLGLDALRALELVAGNEKREALQDFSPGVT